MKPIAKLIATTLLGLAATNVVAGELITVYKSPTCGCCSAWIKHLKANGFEVQAHDTSRMDQVKQSLGVRPQHASCHTAEVSGYVIEGHVPANDIRRLLQEKTGGCRTDRARHAHGFARHGGSAQGPLPGAHL
nr:DUF411 domain-containing protein [Sedimenticola selenatireducens]